MTDLQESIWERFRNHTATESDLRAIWDDNERECATNSAIARCPDFDAFMRPLIWQIERMEAGATMAEAMEALAIADTGNE